MLDLFERNWNLHNRNCIPSDEGCWNVSVMFLLLEKRKWKNLLEDFRESNDLMRGFSYFKNIPTVFNHQYFKDIFFLLSVNNLKDFKGITEKKQEEVFHLSVVYLKFAMISFVSLYFCSIIH